MTLKATLYGIKSCDSVRKARQFLQSQGVELHFHDYRDTPLTQEQLRHWCQHLGYKALLNTRSTTWRGLSDEQKQCSDEASAMTLMLAHPTLIKRPILEINEHLIVGFNAERYTQLLQGVSHA